MGFLKIFGAVLGVFSWAFASIALIGVGLVQPRAKQGLPLVISGVLLLLLGYSFEIYGLLNWWLK